MMLSRASEVVTLASMFDFPRFTVQHRYYITSLVCRRTLQAAQKGGEPPIVALHHLNCA